MPVRTSFQIDGAAGDVAAATRSKVQGDADQALRRMAVTHTRAMSEVAAKNVDALRADVLSGGFFNAIKLSKTWQKRVYPNGGFSVEPAAYIFNKASEIIDAFTLGVTITVSSRQFLAIPVGPAKAIVRRLNEAKNRSRDDDGKFVDESDTVVRVAAALGVAKLESKIDRALGAGVLVAPGQKLNDRGRKLGAKNDDTVLFVLVRSATLKRRIAGRTILAKFDAQFEGDFNAAIARNLSPEDRG